MRPPYPSDAAPYRFDDDGEPRIPVLRVAGFGMAIFLVSLSVLFIASLVGYLAVRYGAPASAAVAPPQVPMVLWISTLVLALSAVSMHLADAAARRGHPGGLRAALLITFALGLGFTFVQAPALLGLLDEHDVHRHTGLYGLAFFLILLHALHVVGGLVALGWLSYRASSTRHAPPGPGSVRLVAAYWHFLELVWLVLFGMFIVTG